MAYVPQLHPAGESSRSASNPFEFDGVGSAIFEEPMKPSANNERVFRMAFAGVYPHYLTKVEKKGRTKEELHTVIHWLTGYDEKGLDQVIANRTDFATFFAQAPQLNANVSKITGLICGYRVEDIEDPLMQQIRYLDKLVDELAKGKKMESILRK